MASYLERADSPPPRLPSPIQAIFPLQAAPRKTLYSSRSDGFLRHSVAHKQSRACASDAGPSRKSSHSDLSSHTLARHSPPPSPSTSSSGSSTRSGRRSSSSRRLASAIPYRSPPLNPAMVTSAPPPVPQIPVSQLNATDTTYRVKPDIRITPVLEDLDLNSVSCMELPFTTRRKSKAVAPPGPKSNEQNQSMTCFKFLALRNANRRS